MTRPYLPTGLQSSDRGVAQYKGRGRVVPFSNPFDPSPFTEKVVLDRSPNVVLVCLSIRGGYGAIDPLIYHCRFDVLVYGVRTTVCCRRTHSSRKSRSGFHVGLVDVSGSSVYVTQFDCPLNSVRQSTKLSSTVHSLVLDLGS